MNVIKSFFFLIGLRYETDFRMWVTYAYIWVTHASAFTNLVQGLILPLSKVVFDPRFSHFYSPPIFKIDFPNLHFVLILQFHFFPSPHTLSPSDCFIRIPHHNSNWVFIFYIITTFPANHNHQHSNILTITSYI